MLFRKKEHVEQKAVLYQKSEVIDLCQKIQANIKFSNVDDPIRTILITSCFPSEGKTTLACNLANSYAICGKSICVVDLDLRRSRVHRAFNIEKGIGVVDYLIGNATIDEITRKTAFNIDVITAGSKATFIEQLLQSETCHKFVKELKQKYDYVIFDSAPVFVSSDSLIASTYADGVVFAIESNSTRRPMIRESLALLRRAKANVIGVVLTKIRVSFTKSRNSKYYNYN